MKFGTAHVLILVFVISFSGVLGGERGFLNSIASAATSLTHGATSVTSAATSDTSTFATVATSDTSTISTAGTTDTASISTLATSDTTTGATVVTSDTTTLTTAATSDGTTIATAATSDTATVASAGTSYSTYGQSVATADTATLSTAATSDTSTSATVATSYTATGGTVATSDTTTGATVATSDTSTGGTVATSYTVTGGSVGTSDTSTGATVATSDTVTGGNVVTSYTATGASVATSGTVSAASHAASGSTSLASSIATSSSSISTVASISTSSSTGPVSQICPGNPPCSGKGACVTDSFGVAMCQCTGNYSGMVCETETVAINILVNVTNPTVVTVSAQQPSGQDGANRNNSVSFEVVTNQIREISPDGSIVRSINLGTGKIFSSQNIGSQSKTWSFSETLENGANFTIQMNSYSASIQTSFAGESFTIAANSLKFYFKIQNFPFSNIKNTLGLVLGAQCKGDASTNNLSSSTSGCSSYNQTTDKSGSVLSFQAGLAGNAIYGKFVQNGVIDGLITPLKFEQASEGFFMVRIPYFSVSAEIDPNYAILLQSNSEQNGDGGSGGQDENLPPPSSAAGSKQAAPTAVIVGVVVSVCGVALIFASVLYARKVYLRKKAEERLKRVTVSNMEPQVSIDVTDASATSEQ